MNKYHLFFILFFWFLSAYAEYGYICVPVADLIAEPFESKTSSISDLYNRISLSPERHKDSCTRIHQAIFNEKVKILDYKGEQVYIALTNCYSVQMPRQAPTAVKAWTRADWVISITELQKESIDLTIFPEPFCENNQPIHEEVITLIVPWYDPITHKTYSAGTRLITVPSLSKDINYTVILYDYENNKTVYATVPYKAAFPTSCTLPHERKKAFVELLYYWCSLEQSIPYVWGGSSFTYTSDSDTVILEEGMSHNNKIAYWNDPTIVKRPYAGFDCSGLLLRAAQIVGIPYFCINSTSVLHTFVPLLREELLEEGDIIWAPGYVSIVGSIEHNELIEAQGYSRGYGNVHAISLEKRFKGITTWDDFIYFYQHRLPLQSLNRDGLAVGYVPTYFIFKFGKHK